jgi:hypothetical protein
LLWVCQVYNRPLKIGRKVIAGKQLPQISWPVTATGMWYLLLDKWHAPGWVWGVVGTFMAIIWIICGIDIYTRDQVEIKLP